MNPRRTKAVKPELTGRLVSAESIAHGLDELLSKLLRYTLIIDRPSFSWESGQSQSSHVVLFEDEKVVVDGAIDPRLLKARRVTIKATSSDRGVANIDLTSRDVQVQVATDELQGLIKEFNERLLSGARSRWFTGQAQACLVTVALLAAVAPFVVDVVVNPKVRHAVSTTQPNQSIPWDAWSYRVALMVLVLGIVPVLISVGLGVIRARSGPLGIWPRGLTLRSLAQTLYKVRISETLRKHVSSIVVAVITAVIVLLIGKIV